MCMEKCYLMTVEGLARLRCSEYPESMFLESDGILVNVSAPKAKMMQATSPCSKLEYGRVSVSGFNKFYGHRTFQ